MADFLKLKELGKRVYNNKMIEDKTNGISDPEDIKALCEKVFGDGHLNPDPSLLHMFNNLVVVTADEVAKPRVDNIMNFIANYQTRNPGDSVVYEVPKQSKVKIVWSALGTGVDVVRIGEKKKIPAVGKPFQFGAYYEPLDMIQDSVVGFQNAVNAVADAKVKLYMTKLGEVVADAVSKSTIPTANVLSASNISMADYRKLESKLMRYGGRPVFVADTLLIDHFGQQLNSDTYKNLLTDELRTALLSDLTIAQLGRSVAVTLVNPFTDETNSATELAVNKGYMLSGGQGNLKPFYVTEFGGMRQLSEQDPEDERIKIKVVQEADITLMYGECVGYVNDSSVIL